MITYGYTILYVENVEDTLSFYSRAFGLAQKMLTPEKDYGELETGHTKLAFASYAVAEYNGIAVERRDSTAAPAPFEIALITENIEASWMQAVEAGAVVVKEPAQKPWGQTVGYLRDPNGFLVELCTRVEIT